MPADIFRRWKRPAAQQKRINTELENAHRFMRMVAAHLTKRIMVDMGRDELPVPGLDFAEDQFEERERIIALRELLKREGFHEYFFEQLEASDLKAIFGRVLLDAESFKKGLQLVSKGYVGKIRFEPVVATSQMLGFGYNAFFIDVRSETDPTKIYTVSIYQIKRIKKEPPRPLKAREIVWSCGCKQYKSWLITSGGYLYLCKHSVAALIKLILELGEGYKDFLKTQRENLDKKLNFVRRREKDEKKREGKEKAIEETIEFLSEGEQKQVLKVYNEIGAFLIVAAELVDPRKEIPVSSVLGRRVAKLYGPESLAEMRGRYAKNRFIEHLFKTESESFEKRLDSWERERADRELYAWIVCALTGRKIPPWEEGADKINVYEDLASAFLKVRLKELNDEIKEYTKAAESKDKKFETIALRARAKELEHVIEKYYEEELDNLRSVERNIYPERHGKLTALIKLLEQSIKNRKKEIETMREGKINAFLWEQTIPLKIGEFYELLFALVVFFEGEEKRLKSLEIAKKAVVIAENWSLKGIANALKQYIFA